jgi:hypothetical protein
MPAQANPGQSDRAPYRPVAPNEHWLAGASARRCGAALSDCDLSYCGSRWEWEAGWEWSDYEIGRERIEEARRETYAVTDRLEQAVDRVEQAEDRLLRTAGIRR